MMNPVPQDIELLKPRLGTSGRRRRATGGEKSCRDPFRDWISTIVGKGKHMESFRDVVLLCKTRPIRNICRDKWLSVVPGPILTMTGSRIYHLTLEAGRGQWVSARTVVRRTDTSGGTRPAWNKTGESVSRCVHVLSPWSQKVLKFCIWYEIFDGSISTLEEIRPVHIKRDFLRDKYVQDIS